MNEKVEISNEGNNIVVHGTKSKWFDIMLILEGLAVVAAACVGDNPKNINTPEEMNAYLKEYIDKIKYGHVSNTPDV